MIAWVEEVDVQFKAARVRAGILFAKPWMTADVRAVGPARTTVVIPSSSSKGVFVNWRYSALLLLALAASACSTDSSTSDDPVCDVVDPEKVEGRWLVHEHPTIGAFPEPLLYGMTDGGAFVLVGTFQDFATLDPVSGEFVGKRMANAPDIAPDSWAASPEYVFFQGGHDTTKTGPIQFVNQAALLDRNSETWTQFDPPVEFRQRSGAESYWTGEEFLVWGGSTSEAKVFEKGTEIDLLSDGVLFNPETETWRLVPPAAEDETYRFGDKPGVDQRSSVWTTAGLFVWGVNRSGAIAKPMLFDVETVSWSPISMAGGPSPRSHASLVASSEHIYLLGGRIPDGDTRLREIWRMSLEDFSWQKVDIPTFVDPRNGAWVDGKLFVQGTCANDALYDADGDTWSQLSSDSAPLNVGIPFSVNGHVVVHQDLDSLGEVDFVSYVLKL